jgi:amino acid transporter
MTLFELLWQVIVATLGAVGFYVGRNAGGTFFAGLIGAWVALAAWIWLAVILFGAGEDHQQVPTPTDHSPTGNHNDRDETDAPDAGR